MGAAGDGGSDGVGHPRNGRRDPTDSSTETLSAVMEEYVKAIYRIESECDERVSTSALAASLGVTTATVSAALKTLEGRDLLDREQYAGVRLTDAGERVALEILRTHRLLEAFLADKLDYDWTDVHDEADRLEHHVSEELTDRIADVLDHPSADPHGDPIPASDLSLPEASEPTRLTDVEQGERVTVRRIRQQDDAVLRYLDDAGVRPTVELVVLDVASIGMVTVESPTGTQSLPEEISRFIEVGSTASADDVESEG